MSSKSHEMFVNEEDRWSWDKYIQRWNQSELGDADRQRTDDSLRYLRDALGDGYLRRADRQRNPMLFWYFTDWSDAARLAMIRFAEALGVREGSTGYKAILKRVTRPKNLEELLEGRSVVGVAYKFFRAGFPIEEFEPRVSVINHRGVDEPKNPDMKIVDRETGEFGEMSVADTIEVGIASYDDYRPAREWAASRGIREHEVVESPNILADEIVRAKMKIRDKLKQLPDDKPGIVVLTPAHENVILFVSDIEQLAADLAEVADDYPKLLRVVMFHTFDDGKDESWSVNLGCHTFIRLVRSDGAAERSLTIRNPTCKYPLTAETMKKVDTAFAMD